MTREEDREQSRANLLFAQRYIIIAVKRPNVPLSRIQLANCAECPIEGIAKFLSEAHPDWQVGIWAQSVDLDRSKAEIGRARSILEEFYNHARKEKP